MTSMSFTSLLGQDDAALEAASNAIESLRQDSPRTEYSKLRNEREQATFNLMMRMDPSALATIRQEFYNRSDSVTLTEFIYIMSKHLLDMGSENSKLSRNAKEQRNFVGDMLELFKEVDVNGDGLMEWEEFTKFTVEKASLLNHRFVMATIPEYIDSTASLDPALRQFRRNNVGAMLSMQTIGSFAVLEEHKKEIQLFHSATGRHVTTITTEAVPLAVEIIKDQATIVAAGSDLQIVTYQQLPNKRFLMQHSWATPEAQMSLAYMSSNDILYSGSTSGNIYSWKMSERSLTGMKTGHTGICMKLLALDQLDNLVSASLDTTIGVWDTYTNTIIHRLKGHKKGVFDMSYNPDYRLLFSCGFDHDAFVWSPFVNSLVFKLKGHHASLVGCQSIENSPEVITADEDGVFKLWDVRTFQCVQTFFNNGSADNEPQEHLTCFFHQPASSSASAIAADSGEARIYAGSRRINSFDQKRIVHERTTDFTNIIWVSMNEASLTILTTSNRNLIIWDLLLGSKMLVHNNICGEEISACCLDDRKRKIIFGDVHGRITVYNPLNGAYMKSCANDIDSVVNSLLYLGDNRTFLAGYVNGTMRLYDESKLDDCLTLRTFDHYNMHPELVKMTYYALDKSVITTGAMGQPLKMWDFDTGKCDLEVTVCDERETVVALEVLHPYPLIATSDSVGNIIIWGSRGCKWKGDKIAGFLNLNPVNAEMEPQAKPDANGIPPQRIIAVSSDLSESLEESLGEEDGEDMFCTDDEYNEEVATSMRESIAKWGPLSAATAISWDADSNVFYTGDELGHLRKWSIESVIEELGGMQMIHGNKTKPAAAKISSRKLRRGNSFATTPLTGSTPFVLRQKNGGNFVGVKFCWSLHGHDECIICCTSTPYGVITSSTDNLVKMWTFDGFLVGVLLHSAATGVRSLNWDLSIDIPSIREKEEKEVDLILRDIMEISMSDKIAHPSAAADKGVVLNASDEAKFSRSSLRKRIEQSSRLLGLDFAAEMHPNDDWSESGTSILEDDDMSMSSSASKSTKNAIDEAKNIHRQPGLVSKKKSLNVAQLRRKDHTMQKMAEMYSEKGIKLPVLTTPPRDKHFAPPASTKESFLNGQQGLIPQASKTYSEAFPSKTSKKRSSFLPQTVTRNDRTVHERKTIIAKKCSQYGSYSALESSLAKSIHEHVSTEEKERRQQSKIEKAKRREERRAKEASQQSLIRLNESKSEFDLKSEEQGIGDESADLQEKD